MLEQEYTAVYRSPLATLGAMVNCCTLVAGVKLVVLIALVTPPPALDEYFNTMVQPLGEPVMPVPITVSVPAPLKLGKRTAPLVAVAVALVLTKNETPDWAV